MALCPAIVIFLEVKKMNKIYRQMNFQIERPGENVVVSQRPGSEREFHERRTVRLQVQRLGETVHQICL